MYCVGVLSMRLVDVFGAVPALFFDWFLIGAQHFDVVSTSEFGSFDGLHRQTRFVAGQLGRDLGVSKWEVVWTKTDA